LLAVLVGFHADTSCWLTQSVSCDSCANVSVTSAFAAPMHAVAAR
jgi:hypothetical protein